MADLNGFDANEVEPAGSFEPIPAGKYQAVITESEMVETKAGTGQFLKLTFQVIEGEYENRLVWARLNIENANEQARDIARGQLSAICRAVGVMKPRSSDELHDIPLVIDVKCSKRKDTGDLTNEIKGFLPAGSAKSEPKAKATVGAGAGKAAAPWKK